MQIQSEILFSNIIVSKNNTYKSEFKFKKNLIVLHGFLGMSDNWKTLGNQYAEKNYNVHLIDLRNHGHSFHSNIFNYSVMLEDVYLYCHTKGLEEIHLIGHSMGGKIAMFFASKYPNMVKKMIIVDIGTKEYESHHKEILLGLNAVDFNLKPSRRMVDEILREYIPDLNLRQFLSKNLYWKTPNQLAFRFNLNAFNNNINEINQALSKDSIFLNPTLFLRGSKSNYILDEDINEIKIHFPNSELIKIENAGHWLHVENPEEFLKKTINFLEI